MGCCAFTSPGEPGLPLPSEEDATAPCSSAVEITSSVSRFAHERLRRLRELDESTKVPFILVEITGEGNGEGGIEVCGKDEYGIYDALEVLFVEQWGCEKLDPGDLSEDTKIPFCSAQYKWPGFAIEGDDGLNNMGLTVMRLIDYVCGKLSWTLAVINGGNVGQSGEVREEQIIFKAPHPMNLVAPHMLIELRSAGFIEICADLEDGHQEILESLHEFFADRFQAESLDGHEEFCDRYYRAGDGVFKGSSGSVDSNFGLLSVEVCDKVVSCPGWSLVACNSGNYGKEGEHCEQQLVFRRDEHPLGDASYLQVVLNGSGNVEVNGKEVRGVQSSLDRWLQDGFRCERAGWFREGDMVCRRYTWKAFDMIVANAAMVEFFELQGFEMQVCSQQVIRKGGEQCLEQQLLFRPGKTEVGTVEPHLFLELCAGEGSEELYADEEKTQVLANQHIRLRPIGPPRSPIVEHAMAALDTFIVDYLSGVKDDDRYQCNVFMCRGRFENNLAQWTMRICDFLVDRLGWSFIVCSLCNNGEWGQHRVQQLLFRYDGDKREMPVSRVALPDMQPEDIDSMVFPEYWTSLTVEDLAGVQRTAQVTMSCTSEELGALQTMIDSTFQRVLTRDRAPDDDAPENEEMPYRLEVVHAFRSEHAWLHYRFEARRAEVLESLADLEPYSVKTADVATLLTERLQPHDAFLFHGTNPSSAMSILKTGFFLDHAGSSTGTMFGNGFYLAEASSKSDEYGRDDGGNSYPSLRALLVCRTLIGNPLVVQDAGDHTSMAAEAGFHCVCGDREFKVGTYRELVFTDTSQVYPEFAVIYRRQYDSTKVPEEMLVPTRGTTGRFWQTRGKDGSWKNLPTEVNKVLIQAAKDGEETVPITWHGTDYVFEVRALKALNRRSGNTSQLRRPMHG